MSLGSAGGCLRNHLRVPKQVCFESEVEAYHSYNGCGAASRLLEIATLKSVDPTQQWLHSVCHEYNYSNPYIAVLRALETRFQVCFPDLDSMKSQCHDDEFYSPTQLRTTDELQEAIVLRSASQEEDTIGHFTAVEPVDPLLIIEDWEELRIILRDQSENPPEEVVVVMYGLYQAHVGDRRASSQKDIHAVRECVFRTWDDFLLPGVTAFLHLVRPQEHLQLNEIHVIVEFSSPIVPLPNIDMPSLRRTIWHSVGADHPIVVAAYHTPGTNRFELLRGTGFEWCGPDSRATCNVFIEKALLPPLALARIQQGSLVEVFVHDVLDSDATSTLQVGSALTHGELKSSSHGTALIRGCDAPLSSTTATWVEEEDEWEDGVWSKGQEGNSASGTPGPLVSGTPISTWKPNPNLVENFDAVVPFRHRTTDGHIAFGRTIPPPNWEGNPFLRSAAASGAAFRDDDGELRVLIRSWIASTHSTLILPHRDVILRGQLMHELENRIRRAWPDQISPLDVLRLTTVRRLEWGIKDNDLYMCSLS